MNTIFAVVAIAIVAALALAALLLVLVAIVTVAMNRFSLGSAPVLRRVVIWVVRRSDRASFRRAGDRRDPAAVQGQLDVIRERDGRFDERSVCDAALRAVFFTYVLQTTGERRRLDQVVTSDFWGSPVGRNALRQGASSRPEGTDGGRRRPILNVDFQAGNVEVVDAVAGREGGQDRVTVRIGYRSQAVVQGRAVDRLVAAQVSGIRGVRAALQGRPEEDGTDAADDDKVAQWDQRGWYDWELVRPVGAVTAEEADDWRCRNCGSPFHSDLDTACPACQDVRSSTEGAWLTRRTWLLEP